MSDKKENSEYLCRRSISTRWMDNDVYGHINNVNYYSFFDSAVNGFLIEKGVLDIENGETIGLVVETGCKYFAPLSFPDEIEAGIFVSHIGNSSVRYEIGLFKKGEAAPAAQGFFVHVYVDRASRRPTSIPEKMKSVLKAIERTV